MKKMLKYLAIVLLGAGIASCTDEFDPEGPLVPSLSPDYYNDVDEAAVSADIEGYSTDSNWDSENKVDESNGNNPGASDNPIPDTGININKDDYPSDSNLDI